VSFHFTNLSAVFGTGAFIGSRILTTLDIFRKCMLQNPEFESDTAIANIPGTVNVLEESVTKKRVRSLYHKRCPHEN
jgi:hypothetical protein